MGAVERRSAAMLKKASEMCLKAYQLAQRAEDEYWDGAEEIDPHVRNAIKAAVKTVGKARIELNEASGMVLD